MKRFFQPVPKDGSPAKKRSAAAADSSDAPAVTGGGGVDGSPGEEPRKFLTWNANSLLLRMKSDWSAFSQLVARLDPDVICVQVRDLGFLFGPLFLFPAFKLQCYSLLGTICGKGRVSCNVGTPTIVGSRRHFVEQVGAVRFDACLYSGD
jgi:hypothetical protein